MPSLTTPYAYVLLAFFWGHSLPSAAQTSSAKSQPLTSTTNFTKKYCDGAGAWYMLLTVSNGKFSLKGFAEATNKYHKNKTEPVSVVRGTVTGNDFIFDGNNELTPEGKPFRKIENNVYYEFSDVSGEYSVWKECTISTHPTSSYPQGKKGMGGR